MPTITSPTVSPSCEFKLFFCKFCDQSIEMSAKIKCDECKNYFHKQCFASNNKQNTSDLIQLCLSCSNENRVCTPKGKIEMKMISNQSTATTSQGIRNLRSRAVSIDSRTINIKSKALKKDEQQTHTQTKSKCGIEEKHEKKMKSLESRIEKLENKSCDCLNVMNEKIKNIEKSIRENRLMVEQANQSLSDMQTDYKFIENGYFGLEKRMYMLTAIANRCEAYHDTNVTFDTEIQKQIIDINDNVDKLLSASNKNIQNTNMWSGSDLLDEIHAINERINNLQKKKETEKKEEKDERALRDTLTSIGNAVTCHNKTIITHFGLNGAYGNDVINNIGKNLVRINKVNIGGTNKCTERTSNSQQRVGNNGDGNKRVTVNATTETNTNTNSQNGKIQTALGESERRTQSHSNQKETVFTQTMMYNGRIDEQRFKIRISNATQFNNEEDIRNSIGDALISFLPHLKRNSFKLVNNKLTYEANTFKIKGCSMVVVLPHSINVTKFNDFIQHFFLSRKGNITSNS